MVMYQRFTELTTGVVISSAFVFFGHAFVNLQWWIMLLCTGWYSTTVLNETRTTLRSLFTTLDEKWFVFVL